MPTSSAEPDLLVGLIGWPLGHSVSPAMHNRAFAALGLPGRYLALPVAPGAARDAVAGLKALGFAGANVTVPHKEAVLPALDALDPSAAAVGAVNTVVIERRDDAAPRAIGYNTDVDGFVAALRAGGFAPGPTSRVLVVGAGGASRAVVQGLRGAGVRQIALLDLDPQRARAVAAALGQGEAGVRAVDARALVDEARQADLLVHASPVGMAPHAAASVWPDAAPWPPGLELFDLVYNPTETRLLRQARRAGARGIGGLEMLVQQGARAFALWTGAADLDCVAALMREAAGRALQERG